MSSLTGLLLLAFLVATQCFFSALGFAPRMSRTLPSAHGSKLSMMAEITSGVEFNTIAREWRLKWSPEDNKKSLASVQQTLILFTSTLKKVDGVKGVQRIVCGGCHDYKVITSLDAAKFAAWVSVSN